LLASIDGFEVEGLAPDLDGGRRRLRRYSSDCRPKLRTDGSIESCLISSALLFGNFAFSELGAVEVS
jgi:hypothetical protein